MSCRVAGLLTLFGVALAPACIASQSTLLTALEGSPPPPVLEPTATGLTTGPAALWADPTADPHATGLFFGMSHASYASVRVFHAALGFRMGPRWSLAFASTVLGNLFDTSLTNQDPSLENLRAQAAWARLDATVSVRRFAVSVGVELAGDDNVGVFQSSTLASAHIRLYPLQGDRVAVGFRETRAIGGSVPMRSGGRQAIDFTLNQPLGRSSLSITAAVSRGGLWRYSETRTGYAVAAQLSVLSQLDLGAALGRYSTAYGASQDEWYRSAVAAVRVGTFRLGTRYTSTRLGVGSGFGVSLAYEPLRGQRSLD